MVVGLPGTGIGGLYYFLMIAFMPVRELWYLARDRSSWARWKFIATQWAMVAGILFCMWLMLASVRLGLGLLGIDASRTLAAFRPGASAATVAEDTSAFFAKAAWASAMSLLGCVVTVQILRFSIARRRPLPARPASGPA